MTVGVEEFNRPNFNQFIEGSKVKFDSKEAFTAAVFDLKKELSTSDDYNQVNEIKQTLEELKVTLSKEDDEVKTVIRDVISLAKVHLHALTPFKIEKIRELQRVSDRMFSLEGIDQSIIGDFFPSLLESTGNKEHSLKVLCGGIAFLSAEQLPASIEIAEKLIESLKDKDKVSKLINFCSKDPSKVQSLFIILDYLGLDEFQKKSLEPFNKVFPNISLDQAPKTIKQLDLSSSNVGKVDFSKFEHLESLDLSCCNDLTAEQFNSIPNKASLITLNLEQINVQNFDLSGFTRLKSLILYGSKNLKAAQLSSISLEAKASMEDLDLTFISLKNFKFSGFTGLKKISLSYTEDLTAAQFNAISIKAKASIESLDLSNTVVTDFDFSGFIALKKLTLKETKNLTSAQFNAIPLETKMSIEELNLGGYYIKNSDFDFSTFVNLKKITSDCRLTAEQFNTLPKGNLEEINFDHADLTDFDFSKLVKIKKITLFFSEITATEFNKIPVEGKASLEELTLYKMDVTAFNFSGCIALKSLHLGRSKGLSAKQFNEIPNKKLIEDLSLSNVQIKDFDFSEFINLRDLYLMGFSEPSYLSSAVRALGFNYSAPFAKEFNAIPSEGRASIRNLYLGHEDNSLFGSSAYRDVAGYDFSGFTGLESLILNSTKGLSAEQFNNIPNKNSIKDLNLQDVNVADFEFSELTGLEKLNLTHAREFTALPDNIASFTCLKSLSVNNIPELRSLPTGITNLARGCRVDISDCGLSETVLGNLGSITAEENYQGPRFVYSMSHFNSKIDDTGTTEELLVALYDSVGKTKPPLENISVDPEDSKELKVWLARLSWMADYQAGGERQQALANSIIGYIEKANSDSEFLDTFLAVINGASETCGDRMALSVINLGIAHQMHVADLSDAKLLANLFNRGVRAMNMLEDIAKEKVKSLPFVDEVEIYLAYPTMLKDKLQLPINIEKMLYFGVCCKDHIKQSDLDFAEEIVSNMINDQESLKDFLITRDKWIEALKHNYSQRIEELEQAKDRATGEAEISEDYVTVEANYKKGLIDLTTEALA
jgi:uncharacterized protein YjbI with pentapeptide repeats